VQLTELVGREREREEAGRLLREHRAVTLVGPGGIGKTRLSLAIASDAVGDFEDGVFWVPLAPVLDPDLVEPTVSRALGITGNLSDHVANREMLLVLDNFEQVVEAAAYLAELLGSAPGLKLLVTSREALRITGEWEYAVPSLAEIEAATLFTERARAVRSDFAPSDAVAQLCRRLDGLPLALELAAARVKVLSPEHILARLDHRLDLLTASARDIPARQRTLRATVDWSYELLAQEEQALFARLGVFSGGWTLDAAETICDASLDGMESLVAKSLVRQAGERFAMLETIRECAVERLERSSEGEELRDRHAHFFLEFAEEAAPGLERADQEEWVPRLDDEHDNLRAAIDHFIGSGESQFELRLVAALWKFWFDRGLWEESRRAVERVAGIVPIVASPAWVSVMHGAAWTTWRLGDYTACEDFAEEGLQLSRELGDARLIGRSLSISATCRGDTAAKWERARGLLEESWKVCESAGDLYGMSRAANNLAIGAKVAGDITRAAEGFAQSLSIARQASDKKGCAVALMNLASTECSLGEYALSRAHFAESLTVARKLGVGEVVVEVLYGVANLAADIGDFERAGACVGAAQREGAFGHVLEGWDRDDYDRTIDSIRRNRGEDGLRRAIAAGRSLTLDSVLEYLTADETLEPAPE
jgi:predicted ATPase